ncbi:hypothetical protein EMCG_04520 [[Emmonsia] crescens]|uniref:DNA/RNA-binding domain-containing protein n=1 Tax=[Emmonsia] crescens TaxID=73230 RepID=A0A0G2HRZ3_9EURO|nr:hypothetical protein EMCG_04520 [Emmonsia crescens UAMH 3008]
MHLVVPKYSESQRVINQHELLSTSPGTAASRGMSRKRPVAVAEPQLDPLTNENLKKRNRIVLSYSIFDSPVTSATRIRPCQQKPSPAGEWQPEQKAISAEQEKPLRTKAATSESDDDDTVPPVTPMISQFSTPSIKYEELVEEVRRYYRGIVDIERKCQRVHESMKDLKELTSKQWIFLMSWHLALFHEHHCFYMSSQHPSTCDRLLALAANYNIPSRMRKIGICPLLKFMWTRLPNNREHMIRFIHHAYDMMIGFVETVPRFKEAWFEVLGILGWSRMAIEDEEKNRKLWAGVARYWFQKGLEENHGIGVLHCHLAKCVTGIVHRLFYHTKSFVCIQRAEDREASIKRFFDPVLSSVKPGPDPPFDAHQALMCWWFAKAHATLFCTGSITTFIRHAKHHLTFLDTQIGPLDSKFLEVGICLGNPNVAAMFEYGDKNSILMKIFESSRSEHSAKHPRKTRRISLQRDIVSDAAKFTTSLEKLSYSTYLTFYTLSSILTHSDSAHILPYVHHSLAFIWSLALIPESMMYIESEIPWGRIASYLNMLTGNYTSDSKLKNDSFPISSGPLPEDFYIRGQIWTQSIYPPDFFDDSSIEDDEWLLDRPSTVPHRIERCLWYGYRLVSLGCWLEFFVKDGKKNFRATSYGKELENSAKHPKVFGLPLRAMPAVPTERSSAKKPGPARTTHLTTKWAI